MFTALYTKQMASEGSFPFHKNWIFIYIFSCTRALVLVLPSVLHLVPVSLTLVFAAILCSGVCFIPLVSSVLFLVSVPSTFCWIHVQFTGRSLHVCVPVFPLQTSFPVLCRVCAHSHLFSFASPRLISVILFTCAPQMFPLSSPYGALLQ